MLAEERQCSIRDALPAPRAGAPDKGQTGLTPRDPPSDRSFTDAQGTGNGCVRCSTVDRREHPFPKIKRIGTHLGSVQEDTLYGNCSRVCYALSTMNVTKRLSINIAKANKCKPAKTSGSRS